MISKKVLHLYVQKLCIPTDGILNNIPLREESKLFPVIPSDIASGVLQRYTSRWVPFITTFILINIKNLKEKLVTTLFFLILYI